jgi:peptide deformylase
MSVLKVITAPDPFLQKPSIEVEKIDDKIKEIANNMLDTMYYENGVGLSAVQVGVLLRIITVDVEQKRDENGELLSIGKQYVMINPEILEASQEKKDYDEGCLSFPGESVVVKRPAFIRVKFTNLNNEEQIVEADGLFAVCIQHEIDHLNGITITNYISHLRKEMMIKRLLKRRKNI